MRFEWILLYKYIYTHFINIIICPIYSQIRIIGILGFQFDKVKFGLLA